MPSKDFRTESTFALEFRDPTDWFYASKLVNDTEDDSTYEFFRIENEVFLANNAIVGTTEIELT